MPILCAKRCESVYIKCTNIGLYYVCFHYDGESRQEEPMNIRNRYYISQEEPRMIKDEVLKKARRCNPNMICGLYEVIIRLKVIPKEHII